MKSPLIMLSILALSFIALFFIFALLSKSGHPPGLIDNKLAACSNKPNCVCTEYKADEKHFVPAITVPSNHHDILASVKTVIELQGGKITNEKKNYLAATFSSKFFGFVDDFEIRFDPEHNLLHLRSSARVGYSDMGVNRQRALSISKLISQQL